MVNKVLKTMFFIFTSVASIFIIIGACFTFSYFQKINSEDYIKHTATISDIECHTVRRHGETRRDCDAFVNYKINNKEYNNIRLNFYSSTMNINDTIEIYYNKNNPKELTVKGSLTFGIIFMCFGLFFITIAYFALYKPVKKKEKLIKDLLQNGKQIYAKIIKIKVNRNISINHQHPYYAVCVYTDELGNEHFLNSESTMKELDYWFESKGDTDVLLKGYMDRNNHEIYYIPIEEVL